MKYFRIRKLTVSVPGVRIQVGYGHAAAPPLTGRCSLSSEYRASQPEAPAAVWAILAEPAIGELPLQNATSCYNASDVQPPREDAQVLMPDGPARRPGAHRRPKSVRAVPASPECPFPSPRLTP